MKQVHEKVLNITNYQGNANQDHKRYHLTPIRMAIIQKTKNYKGWQGCKEKGNFVQVGGKVNWCAHYGKQYGCSSRS